MLFLDEPTTGLDPRSRLGMWEIIERLVADGTTVLLTWAGNNINTHHTGYEALLDALTALESLMEAAGLEHRRDGLLYVRAVLRSNQQDIKGALVSIDEAIDVKKRNDGFGWGYTMSTYRRVRLDKLQKLGHREDVEAEVAELLKGKIRQAERVELLTILARCAMKDGENELARARIQASLDVARMKGLEVEKNCLGAAVDIFRACRDFDEARKLAERYLGLVESEGRTFCLSLALEDVVSCALDQGDLPAARRYLGRSIPLATDLDVVRGTDVRRPVVEAQLERLEALEGG